MTSGSSPAELKRVESARYALLRRLALAMRHHMVVHLQPMGMITELLERRLVSGNADITQVQDSMRKIHDMSRAAVESCLDVVTWLAPVPDAQIALDDGVRECMSLLRSNFSFRGLSLQDEPGGVLTHVPRSAVRHVLPAVLLALTDRAPPPADVCVRTREDSGAAQVTVEVKAKEGDPGFPANHPYRMLDWQDVETLAASEGVRVARDAQLARIVFPRLK
jgi:hypothetical protein